jgi:hypothetical protein
MKRRENNQKVITLHSEMRHMIEVLVKCVSLPFTLAIVVGLIFVYRRLETVEEPERVGPDGKTIEDRLKKLVEETADTIEKCANACDTYTKKRLIRQ